VTPPLTAPPSRPWLALAWMTGALVSFVTMAIAGREIQTEMNTFELMLYRSVIGWLIVSFVVSRSARGFAHVRTRHPGLHLLRNTVHFLGQNAWFYAVMLIPLGQLVALEMTNPLWVAVLAPLFLGEPLTRARAFAALLGFAGVVIVAQPGSASLGIGHAAALVSAIAFAMTTIFTRRIMGFDSALCVLFWMTLSQAFMALALSLPGGIPLPSPAMLPWIAVAGITGISAHYCVSSALGVAPATIVAPMEFLRIPVMALAGFWIYGEPLQLAVFAGAALIVSGILVNIHAERRRPPR
jgi:drug/metabolite transporter (DMT)-like permease